MLVYRIDIAYDREAEKFYVLRSDVAGLHAEAKTLPELGDIILDIAPELIDANHVTARTWASAFLRGLFSPPRAREPGCNFRLYHDLCPAY